MKRLDRLEARNLKRTIELHNGDPKMMAAQHALVSDLAACTILNAIDYAATKGIGGITIVNSLLQFSAVWMKGVHSGATINALRLLADQIESAANGDIEAEARICEALMVNGLSFTAALEAERKGGRN